MWESRNRHPDHLSLCHRGTQVCPSCLFKATMHRIHFWLSNEMINYGLKILSVLVKTGVFHCPSVTTLFPVDNISHVYIQCEVYKMFRKDFLLHKIFAKSKCIHLNSVNCIVYVFVFLLEVFSFVPLPARCYVTTPAVNSGRVLAMCNTSPMCYRACTS